MKDVVFNPKCYAIHFDIDSIGVGKFIDKFSKYGDIFFNDNVPIVFLNNGYGEDTIDSIMSSFKIKKYYCEEIFAQDQVFQDTLMSVWYKEKYEKLLEDAINSQAGDIIDSANNNILTLISTMKGGNQQ